jgi:hypothetical protein
MGTGRNMKILLRVAFLRNAHPAGLVGYQPDVPTGHGRFESISLNRFEGGWIFKLEQIFCDKSKDDGRYSSAVRNASAVL